ncbi:MAG: PDZ domain-containing protein [Planctomycetota bacterium]
MRPLLLAVALTLPLLAADSPILVQVVSDFGSDDPDTRDRASRHVRSYLQAELAPLLAALEDSDPEVRRRAGNAILEMLPAGFHEPEPKEEEPLSAGAQIWINLARQNARGIVLKVVPQKEETKREREASKLLREMRMSAEKVGDTLRAQLRLPKDRGLIIASVDPVGRANKFGLRTHDVLVRVNGKPIGSKVDLLRVVGPKPDWAGMVVTVFREGGIVELRPAPRKTLRAPAR